MCVNRFDGGGETRSFSRAFPSITRFHDFQCRSRFLLTAHCAEEQQFTCFSHSSDRDNASRPSLIPYSTGFITLAHVSLSSIMAAERLIRDNTARRLRAKTFRTATRSLKMKRANELRLEFGFHRRGEDVSRVEGKQREITACTAYV